MITGAFDANLFGLPRLDFGDLLPTVFVMLFYAQLSIVIAWFVSIKADVGFSSEDFSTKCINLKTYLRHHNVIKRIRDEVDSHFSKVGNYAGMNLGERMVELPGPIRQSVLAGLYNRFK
jgi:hypothetical protein